MELYNRKEKEENLDDMFGFSSFCFFVLNKKTRKRGKKFWKD